MTRSVITRPPLLGGVMVALLMVAGCGDSIRPLTDETILQSPPAATLLATYRQEGTPAPVEVRSHESRFFASPGTVGEVLRYYLEEAAVDYDFPEVDRGEALRRGWVQILGTSSADDTVSFEVFVSDEPLELTGGGGNLEILTEAPADTRTWVRVVVSR